jgi:nucleoid DNA-binding protein
MNKKQLVAKISTTLGQRKARVGRNPRTGESIQISASQKVKFLPAKSLKEMFNK